MNIYLDRIYPASLSKLCYAGARRIIRIYFGLVFLYPVHPACQGEAFSRSLVDPVRNIKLYFVKFSTGRLRIFFALMAAPVVPGMLLQTN